MYEICVKQLCKIAWLHPFLIIPLQPHFVHVVFRTASSVILFPVWSLNCLRLLASCLQPHTDHCTLTWLCSPEKMHTATTLKSKHSLCHDVVWVQVATCSLIHRLHRERQFYLVTPDLNDREQNIGSKHPSTSLLQLVYVCVCYLSSNDFDPHLLTNINNLRGFLNSSGWHLAHMYQACKVRGKKKKFQNRKHSKIFAFTNIGVTFLAKVSVCARYILNSFY